MFRALKIDNPSCGEGREHYDILAVEQSRKRISDHLAVEQVSPPLEDLALFRSYVPKNLYQTVKLLFCINLHLFSIKGIRPCAPYAPDAGMLIPKLNIIRNKGNPKRLSLVYRSIHLLYRIIKLSRPPSTPPSTHRDPHPLAVPDSALSPSSRSPESGLFD